jgi:hypothetical protein
MQIKPDLVGPDPNTQHYPYVAGNDPDSSCPTKMWWTSVSDWTVLLVLAMSATFPHGFCTVQYVSWYPFRLQYKGKYSNRKEERDVACRDEIFCSLLGVSGS